MIDIVCQRCGKCCHLVIDGRLSSKPCKFLVSVGNNRYACKIYKCENRLGHDIGYGNKCHRRTDVHKNYPGCPYNNPSFGISLGVGDSVDEEKK